MNFFKKLALAAVMTASFLPGAQAQATTTDFVWYKLNNSTENTPGVFTGTYIVDDQNVAGTEELLGASATRAAGHAFADFYLLQLNDDRNLSFFVSTPIGFLDQEVTGQVSFSSFSLTDISYNETFAPTSTNQSSFALASNWTLHSGTYFLGVYGTLNVDNAAYSGALFAVSPSAVPEPASLALLLGGLGAVGAVVRRRGTVTQA